MPGSVSFTGTLPSGVGAATGGGYLMQLVTMVRGCPVLPGMTSGVKVTAAAQAGMSTVSPWRMGTVCAGSVQPEGDVPGSVSFTDTLPSGVGAPPGPEKVKICE